MTSPAPEDSIPDAAFFVAKNGETFGPHSVEEIHAFLAAGVVSPDDLLWREGMPEWIAIGDLIEPPPFPAEVPDAAAKDAWPERDPDAPLWARSGPDGTRGRLSISVGAAIFLHLSLLVAATLGAQVIFSIPPEAPAPAPPEPAPLEVTMVEEPDQPPPPQPELPPPPPDIPPPPPAVPDMPLPTVMTPPTPTPLDIPQPDIAPPTTLIAPVAPLPAPVTRVARPSHTAAQASPAPVATAPVDAGPSDYLYAPAPPYPYAARKGHESGTVKLLVLIDAMGLPVSVSVSQSSGFPLLDDVARKQVEQEFRFRVGSTRQLLVPITFEENPSGR